MANPDRPQYQDTISEVWGQAVADTVVRRYATTADRDADLGAIDPAQLAGQVVAIGSGRALVLQIHNGTDWRSVAGMGARYYRATAFTIAGTPSVVGGWLDTREFDDFSGAAGGAPQAAGDIYSMSADKITIPWAGLWRIEYQSTATVANGQWMSVGLLFGSSTGGRRSFGAAGQSVTTWQPAYTSYLARLAAGDVICPTQQGSVNLNGQGQRDLTWLQIQCVGP